jgi:hypothetical protein
MFTQFVTQFDLTQLLLASVVVPTIVLLVANVIAAVRAPAAARV